MGQCKMEVERLFNYRHLRWFRLRTRVYIKNRGFLKISEALSCFIDRISLEALQDRSRDRIDVNMWFKIRE